MWKIDPLHRINLTAQTASSSSLNVAAIVFRSAIEAIRSALDFFLLESGARERLETASGKSRKFLNGLEHLKWLRTLLIALKLVLFLLNFPFKAF